VPRQITDGEGASWDVSLTGRHTQYARDEISVVFRRVGPAPREERFARFSPRGAKSPEQAYEEVSTVMLTRLLDSSQQAWTAPDGGYAAGG
jgi:hypothetical protein